MPPRYATLPVIDPLRRSPKLTNTRDFVCVIDCRALHDRFTAKVEVKKRVPIRTSLQTGQIDLADIFITPVSGQLPGGKQVHHHFVVHDFSGQGVYIVRDPHGRDALRRPASVWDLGLAFGSKVVGILKELA